MKAVPSGFDSEGKLLPDVFGQREADHPVLARFRRQTHYRQEAGGSRTPPHSGTPYGTESGRRTEGHKDTACRRRSQTGRSYRAGRTLDQYKSEYKRFAKWFAEAHPNKLYMRDITERYALEYAATLDTDKVTASTFNQHRNFLWMLWRILRDDARLQGNPWDIIEHRKVEKLVRQKRTLEPQEYEAILAAAESAPDLKDLFIMLAWTGQRLVDVV